MSIVFYTALIYDNAIDIDFISDKFNISPENNGTISAIYDDAVFPSMYYHGSLDVGGERGVKYCCVVENGDRLFQRKRYAYYSKEREVILAPPGDEVVFSMYDTPETTGETIERMIIEAEASINSPPTKELEELFNHILAHNKHFYIMFYTIEIEEIAPDKRTFLETLVKKREVYKYTPAEARKVLVDMFEGSLSYLHTYLKKHTSAEARILLADMLEK